MIQAILFDLDGLLTDTEQLHCRAYQQVLAEDGVLLTHDEYAEIWIRTGGGIIDLCKLKHLSHDPENLRRRKAAVYQTLVRAELQPMPGSVDLLKRIHGRIRLALATASWMDAATCVIDTIGIRQYFELIVTGSDVKRAKPHPDIFLLAAERLGVPPDDCMVIEDAEKGILAAHAAGMKSIAVPNRHTYRHDFTHATHIVASLNDITDDMLGLPSSDMI